jgi:hypothetical protein
MTKRMEQAIDRLQKLAPEDQDRVAAFVLHELEDDAAWKATTAKHADGLKGLVDQILTEDRSGQTDHLDPEKL